jgi:hypothetical protein
MNHAKIAAALHALADAFLADVEAVEEAVTGKRGKKAAQPPQPQPQPAPAPTTLPAAAQSTVAHVQISTPAVAEPATPPAPAITKEQLNKAVLAVAAKNRDAAVALLGKFGLTNTVNLPPEKFQAVFDAFEEELARIDAAAVQVAQASLV